MNKHFFYSNKSLIVGVSLLVIILGVGCGASPKVITMDILINEWAVEQQSEILNAGLVTFNVTNNGAMEHNFIIVGIDETIELVLPGETIALEVDLEPGSYIIYCNLPGHQEAGMETSIIVTK